MKHLEKYNETERKELITAFAMMGMMGIPAPATVEELEKWCDTYLADKRAEEEKTAERKAKAKAAAEIPGYNTHKNWKRKGTEIAKLKAEMEKMARRLEMLEEERMELAEKYREETGNEIK